MDATTAHLVNILTSPALGYLLPREREAIVRLVMTTFVPSARTKRIERLRIRRSLVQLPWAWESSDQTDDGLVDRSELPLDIGTRESDIQGLATELAAARIRSRTRESLYQLVVSLAIFDGAYPGELIRLDPLASALRIEASRRAELMHTVRVSLNAGPGSLRVDNAIVELLKDLE